MKREDAIKLATQQYLRVSRIDLTNSGAWQPADWVINAIMAAHDQGCYGPNIELTQLLGVKNGVEHDLGNWPTALVSPKSKMQDIVRSYFGDITADSDAETGLVCLQDFHAWLLTQRQFDSKESQARAWEAVWQRLQTDPLFDAGGRDERGIDRALRIIKKLQEMAHV